MRDASAVCCVDERCLTPLGDYQSIMLPTLMAFADGLEAPLSNIRTRVAVAERLTDQDISERLPSGRQTVLANRVS